LTVIVGIGSLRLYLKRSYVNSDKTVYFEIVLYLSIKRQERRNDV